MGEFAEIKNNVPNQATINLTNVELSQHQQTLLIINPSFVPTPKDVNWINLCQDSNKLTNQLRIKSVKNQKYRQKYREKAKSSTLMITVITSKRRRCVNVITTAQLHLIIPELTF